MITSQVSPEAGMVPSSASVALPEKAMLSPTFQVRLASGVLMVGCGGVVVEPAVMVMGWLSPKPPRWSVTFRRVTKLPGVL
jgi:hypothetical protein